jgi:outer membrane protein assembly factor BamB
MFGGDLSRNLANTTEKGIPDTWSVAKNKQKNIRWQAQLGGTTFGGPIVSGGKIFVGTSNERPRDASKKGDKGVIMCFEEKTGKFLWQIVHDKNPEPIDAKQCGIASTPAIEGNRLWYVSNRCELICADTADGKEQWKLDMIKEMNVYPGGIEGGLPNCSPLVVGDLVYVCTSNGVDEENKKPPHPEAPSLIAVEKATGKVVWKDSSPGANILDGQWSSPAAAEIDGKVQIIFGGGDGWLRGFDGKTGELLWKFDCNPKDAKFIPGGRGNRNYFVATPVVYDKKVYIGTGLEPDAGTGIGHFWCIDPAKKPANKDKDLSPVKDNFDPKAPANKDSGLVWHYGGPILPKPEDGSREYRFGRTVSTVAIHDGLVYAAELAGFLHCLDAKTGEHYWEFDLKTDVWSSPYYVDGKVFMGTNGDLFVFKANKKLEEPKTLDLEQALKTPPTAANGTLYFSNGLNLFAIGK